MLNLNTKHVTVCFRQFQDIPVVDKAGTISTRKLIRRKLDRRGQI